MEADKLLIVAIAAIQHGTQHGLKGHVCLMGTCLLESVTNNSNEILCHVSDVILVQSKTSCVMRREVPFKEGRLKKFIIILMRKRVKEPDNVEKMCT